MDGACRQPRRAGAHLGRFGARAPRSGEPRTGCKTDSRSGLGAPPHHTLFRVPNPQHEQTITLALRPNHPARRWRNPHNSRRAALNPTSRRARGSCRLRAVPAAQRPYGLKAGENAADGRGFFRLKPSANWQESGHVLRAMGSCLRPRSPTTTLHGAAASPNPGSEGRRSTRGEDVLLAAGKRSLDRPIPLSSDQEHLSC